MTKQKIFVLLVLLLYVIFALHLTALYFHWYWIFWWYDILLHFLGGLWLGGTALWFLKYVRNKDIFNNIFSRYVYPIIFVTFIGIAWEVFEFSLDTFIIFQTNDIVDTISDLGMDVVGGLTASLLIKTREIRDGITNKY